MYSTSAGPREGQSAEAPGLCPLGIYLSNSSGLRLTRRIDLTIHSISLPKQKKNESQHSEEAEFRGLGSFSVDKIHIDFLKGIYKYWGHKLLDLLN